MDQRPGYWLRDSSQPDVGTNMGTVYSQMALGLRIGCTQHKSHVTYPVPAANVDVPAYWAQRGQRIKRGVGPREYLRAIRRPAHDVDQPDQASAIAVLSMLAIACNELL